MKIINWYIKQSETKKLIMLIIALIIALLITGTSDYNDILRGAM